MSSWRWFRAYAPDAHRLHHGGDSAYEEGREDRPGEVGLAPARDADHDHRRQHDPGNTQRGLLEAQAESEKVGRLLVRLVTDR